MGVRLHEFLETPPRTTSTRAFVLWRRIMEGQNAVQCYSHSLKCVKAIQHAFALTLVEPIRIFAPKLEFHLVKTRFCFKEAMLPRIGKSLLGLITGQYSTSHPRELLVAKEHSCD